jgi:hypothetical protein
MDQALNSKPALAETNFWTETRVDSDAWLTRNRFALLLGFFILAFFPSVLFGTQTFFFRDYGVFGYPLASYHRDCFWRGELPVWNSLSNCGLPYLAQWNTLTLYPLSLIYIVFPLPWSLSFFCLGHLFLAGLGMYVLAKSWTNDRLAAAIAGFAFAFNGLTLNCLMWPNNIAALGWMPWVVWAVSRGWEQGGRALLVGVFVGAIQMLSGAPEIILFTWLIIGALWVAGFFTGNTPKFTLFSRLLIMTVLTGAMAAAQLLPFLDLLRHCERDNEYGTGTWAMPQWGWLNLVLPLFKCHQSASGPCFQPRQGWTTSYYPGIGILVFALFSSRFVEQRKVALFWGLALAGLLLALGDDGYVYTLLHKALPASGLMRFPIKFVVLATFALPLLASFAVAQFRLRQGKLDSQTDPARRWVITISILMTCVIIGAMCYSYWHPFGKITWSTLVQNAGMRILCLAMMLGILIRLKKVETPRVQMVLQIALIACVGIDTWTHAPNQNPTVSPGIYAPHVVAREMNVPPASESPRAFITRGTFDVFFRSMLANPEKDFLGKRFGLLGNCNLLDDVSTPDGFYSLYLPEQRDLWSFLFRATNFPSGLADFLAISRISTNVFEWQTRASARPIMSIGARPVYADPPETGLRLLDPNFDSRQVVYLPLDAKLSLARTNVSNARIVHSAFSNSKITATTESPEPAILVIAQSYYHHWKATVDGKPAKIWRANHAFQAIEVPAGQRQIKLVYQDDQLVYGSVISGSALIGCLAAWFGKRKRPAQSPV